MQDYNMISFSMYDSALAQKIQEAGTENIKRMLEAFKQAGIPAMIDPMDPTSVLIDIETMGDTPISQESLDILRATDEETNTESFDTQILRKMGKISEDHTAIDYISVMKRVKEFKEKYDPSKKEKSFDYSHVRKTLLKFNLAEHYVDAIMRDMSDDSKNEL